jgi:ankyrin repeat protein
MANFQNWTPLHFAAANRSQFPILKRLVESGANVFAKTSEDVTAIHIAYANQFNEALMYLNSFYKKF